MTLLEEVKAFARDYVNGNQTKERRLKIKAAYYQITGENLRHTCSTCYVEAIFKILNYMKKEPTNYKLRKGAVLQAFGNSEMFCTADNLTDERAEWHLRNTRGAASLFETIPVGAPSYGDPEPTDEPAKTENKPAAEPVTEAKETEPLDAEHQGNEAAVSPAPKPTRKPAYKKPSRSKKR